MGRLKSFIYAGALFLELPILLIGYVFYELRYISEILYSVLWTIIITLFTYRIICYFTDKGIAGRINDYFALIELPYFNIILVHEKVIEEAIKDYSCTKKIKKMLQTAYDLKPILKENKKYITFTHDTIISRLINIEGINIITKKQIYKKRLEKVQEQIYGCKKRKCDKLNECGIRKVGLEIRNFYFVKFTYKKDS